MLQIGDEALGKRDSAIFVSFSFANDDLFPIEIDVFDSQAASFHEAQARSVHQAAHDPFGTGFDGIENLGDFGGRQNDGKFRGPFGSECIDFDFGLEDFHVQE